MIVGNKQRNTNYDILDKILAEADRAGRQAQPGRKGNGQGLEVLSKEEFDELYKTMDDLEKYLRS